MNAIAAAAAATGKPGNRGAVGDPEILEVFRCKPESDVGESERRMRRSDWGFIVPHWIRAKRRSDFTAFVIAECSCTPDVVS
jgi:hypothetical protein